MNEEGIDDKIVKALVAAQKEIQAPVKDKINPRFKSGYSSLDAIYNAVRGPLAKQGLTLSHSVEYMGDRPILVTTLRHVSGESIENKIPMFVEHLTSQGFASALTYARRYATCSLLSLPSDEDDDGEAAENPGISEAQEKELLKMIGKDDALTARILKGYGKDKITDIPAAEFEVICKRIKEIQAKAGK